MLVIKISKIFYSSNMQNVICEHIPALSSDNATSELE